MHLSLTAYKKRTMIQQPESQQQASAQARQPGCGAQPWTAGTVSAMSAGAVDRGVLP